MSELFNTQVVKTEIQNGAFLLLTLRAYGFSHSAGQYIVMNLKAGGETLQRYYSIASAPNSDNTLEFCLITQDGSPTSQALLALKPGDEVEISKAQGKFSLHNPSKPHVFIAGGTGVAPLRAFIGEMTANFSKAPSQPINLVLGAKTGDLIPFYQGLHKFAGEHANFNNWFVAENDVLDGMHKGLVTGVISDVVLADADYYICGGKPMAEAVVSSLKASGVKDDSIFVEAY